MMMHPRSGSDKRLSTVHVDGDTPLCITSGALTWINDSFQKNVHRAISITELECQLEAVQREAFAAGLRRSDEGSESTHK